MREVNIFPEKLLFHVAEDDGAKDAFCPEEGDAHQIPRDFRCPEDFFFQVDNLFFF